MLKKLLVLERKALGESAPVAIMGLEGGRGVEDVRGGNVDVERLGEIK